MDEPYLLLLEGSGAFCSVAVSRGDRLLSLQETEDPFVHTEEMTLLIEAACREAGISLPHLSAVAVSEGPGSYTSLRVSTSTAKGICYALNKPLLAIPSLLILASGMKNSRAVTNSPLLAPMIDARRKDVYIAWYDVDLRLVVPDQLQTLGPELPDFARNRSVWVGGSGEAKAVEILGESVRPTGIRASARYMVSPGWAGFTEGRFVDLSSYAPRYITAPRITNPKKKW